MSVIVFEALFVLLAYNTIYDNIPIVLILVLLLLTVLFYLVAATIFEFETDSVFSFLCFAVALVVCVLIGMRPHMAKYEAELVQFAMRRGYYIADVEKSGGALKTYSWKQAGGVFTQPIFVDLVFDPHGTGDWTQERKHLEAAKRKNLEAARPEQFPEWLTDDHCKHAMEVMPEHFYVVTSVCQWP